MSFWEITPGKIKGTYDAQEHGLGGVKGTAQFRDGVLTISWLAADGASGTYEWRIMGSAGKGLAGKGRLTR